MRRGLLLGLACSGCFLFGGGGGDGDPCDDDRFACEEGMFALDPTCELADELVVHIGVGDGEFQPLAEGQQPPVFSGSQGGQHTILGIRIDNPALDRYDTLRVRLGVYGASACPAPEDDDLTEPCSGRAHGGERVVVLGDDVPLSVTASGEVEEFGIVVLLSEFPESQMVIQGIVEDPCGRQGIARHRMPW